MTTATSPILLKWDPKSLEIRTLTVERLLEPLVTQVTTLVNTSNKGPSSKKKGRSKKAHVLAVSVEQATQNFLEKGEQIAKDSQDLKEELIAAVDDVRKQGETMRVASSEFADDPCSSVKRGTMVRAARALLSAVTRLLILADMADVMRLLAHLKIVEEALEAVKNATNEQDLANRFKEFGKEMVKLNYVAARRQQELKDPQCRDEMAAARGALKKNATMLYTASQAFLRHPDVAATRANRDYVFKQVQEAIGGISSAAQASSPTDEKHGHAGIGELAAALNEFDNKIILDPLTFSEARFRPSLEERLESIISGAALMADSSCTRDDRRERIVAECNAVRQALQDLLSEYMNNRGGGRARRPPEFSPAVRPIRWRAAPRVCGDGNGPRAAPICSCEDEWSRWLPHFRERKTITAAEGTPERARARASGRPGFLGTAESSPSFLCVSNSSAATVCERKLARLLLKPANLAASQQRSSAACEQLV
ncbi:hypothetical protein MATL_G00222160 [Megalops atlanticus]|uniref:Catenin alpha-2 n=1 Tax=Megalops atlanticus TaxID=7932 RepID=A0A9D3T2M8_MEGAT|nr:hypothetical protein MATL_G00222160 [Megalops atlanticus]